MALNQANLKFLLSREFSKRENQPELELENEELDFFPEAKLLIMKISCAAFLKSRVRHFFFCPLN